jgi:Chaperone of endosialidase
MTQAYQLSDLGQLLTVDAVGNNITLAANSVVVGNSSVNATINSTAFTGTANNTNYVGTVPAGNVVSNAQLSNTLSNYQTTAGLNANIASYLPTYAGVVNASSHTVGTSFIANNSQLTITTPLSANGGVGTAGYVLTSNGATGSPYWAVASVGVNVAAQYTWSNTQTFTNTITHSGNLVLQSGLSANGSFGTANQVLTTNGSVAYWSTVSSGGGGALPARQIYTANGSVNTFTVTGGYYANNLDVYLNGVKLVNGTEANVQNGSTFTILTGNPANGSIIEVVGTSSLTTTGVSTIVNQQITANGSANSFAITNGYIPNGIQVYLNGVKQIPGTDVFTTSGANVGFAVTPSNNHIIDVYGYQTAVSYVSNTIVVGNTQIGINSITLGNTQITTNTITTPIVNGSSTLSLQTGSTTGLYIDASQNVGIGTSSPSYKLDVSGNIRAFGTSTPSLLAENTSTGDAYVDLRSNSALQSRIYYSSSANVVGFTAVQANPLVFKTTDTERMRIDSSGNLLVGTTTSVGKITQYGGQIVSGRLSNTTNYDSSNGSINLTSGGDGNGRGVITFGNSNTTSQNWHFVSGESGASYAIIWYNGNYGAGVARMQLSTGGALSTTTGTLSAISDINFKENIIDAPNYLNLLNQVKVRKFSYKEENSTTQTHIGVIAQEIEEILPEIVFDQKDPVKETVHKTVRYTDFVLMLVKALQELKATVDAQAAEITALKAKVGE